MASFEEDICVKIAFCLHKYFPYGGQQRDFRRIALACQERGHQIVVYTFEWQGEKCPGFEIIIVPKRGHSNHVRNKNFSQWIATYRQTHRDDLLVGFSKMAGLDVYFAADVCYAAKTAQEKGWLYKLTPRYRSYMAAESAVFSPTQSTDILLLTPQQEREFIFHYRTPVERLHLLPPGIDRQLFQPSLRDQYRVETREHLGISADQLFLLQVGSDFRRKGVSRSLEALASLPDHLKVRIQFWVVGADKPAAYIKQAEHYGLAQQVVFHQGREDIPQLMAAADLLLHPAHQEAAGIVLIEALASGLPIVCTEVCGNAPYIVNAGAGIILPTPFNQEQMNTALTEALSYPEKRQQWSQAALDYCTQHDIYRLPEDAADIIEKRARDAATTTTV